MILPKSKEEAIKLGVTSYFTNVPCKNGHVDKRYTNTGICYACKRLQNNRDYEVNKDTWIKNSRLSYKKHRDKRIDGNRRWASNNRQKSNEIKKRYKIRNRASCLASAREYQRNKRKDPLFRLNRAMSKAVWAWLKSGKGFRHWETFVEFTLSDLIAHLEKKFTSEMNWDNYGTYWEVDHVKPISLCETFEEAWKLNNLQPLTCSKNRSKGNKFNEL